ncbi:hypothetical protein [Terasakiella sp.]|uniref:hypothetical protein n=1 Tax=Terasakiella sp. TaxID=2034861 RepID=UPI003AA98859
MTPQQLQQAGEALFGPQWQTALARSLGMKDASLIRKILSGSRALTDNTARRIRLLMAHDEWIVGDGADTGHEYIVHTRYPRFIAKVASEQAGDDADILSGITYACADGDQVLCEFIWSDKPPESDDLVRLLQRADAALEAAAYDAMD